MKEIMRHFFKRINNELGCFGGGGPDPPDPVPPPDPPPTPTPSDVASKQSQQDRTSKLKNLRFGLANTIKTSPKGLTGQGADLSNRSLQGKTKLG